MSSTQPPVYADLIIPVPVPRLFTYFIPTELRNSIAIGQRVVVQFGKKKLYAAVVGKLHHTPPQAYEAKDIIDFLSEEPIVTETHLKLWVWIAEYYMCGIGEVMNAALPSVFKLQSETLVRYNHDFIEEDQLWTDKEAMVLDALKLAETLSISDLEDILGAKKVMPTVYSLMDHGVLEIQEEVSERYSAKKIDYIQLAIEPKDEALQEAFESIKRAPKQSKLLLYFLSKTEYGKKSIQKKELLDHEDFSPAVLKPLIDKGILTIHQEEVSRQIGKKLEDEKDHNLSPAQAKAFQDIKAAFQSNDIGLLHGVTSSGKTSIYIELIKEQLEQGKDVLYMLPEIALTTQIIERLQLHFGEQVLVYHSKLNGNERADVWKQVLKNEGKGRLLIGTRSSIFLPVQNIGLIIVDEEHDGSYKQHDPAPRYHARDAAIVLSKFFKTKTLLGSATPSIESFYNCKLNKYFKIDLHERYGGVALPNISFINMKKARLQKLVQGDFSDVLVEEISKNLESNKQVILFQNRRGYAPMLECQYCGWVPQCKSCDISLTYHKAIHKLKCHYCGYTEPVQQTCGSCGTRGMIDKGLGTQKIEEELRNLFPDARLARMDQDTTRKKNALPNLIEKFSKKEVDILIGTQMLTKGLDFDNVGLVGVLNADNMLHFPDFRAFERSFQLLTQVSGRAGRRDETGQVLIQSYNPEHPILQQVAMQDQEQLFKEQIAERKLFGYPPIVRMVRITLKHKNYQTLNEAADFLKGPLKQKFGTRVLGPEFPAVARIRNLYHKHFVLKFEKQHAQGFKTELQAVLNGFALQGTYRSVRVVVDVDPY